MAFQFDPFPVLRTQRLVLRAMEMRDLEAFYYLRTAPEMNVYIDRPVLNSVEEVVKLMERIWGGVRDGQSVFWAMSLVGDERMIGTMCIWNLDAEKMQGEVGYVLHPDYQGQGLMGEALAAAVDYGWTMMGLQRIEAYTHKDNVASVRLLERYGFERDAVAQAMMDVEEQEWGLEVWRKV